MRYRAPRSHPADNRPIRGSGEYTDLTGWTIDLYLDGSTTVSKSIELVGIVLATQVFVIARDKADAGILPGALDVLRDDERRLCRGGGQKKHESKDVGSHALVSPRLTSSLQIPVSTMVQPSVSSSSHRLMWLSAKGSGIRIQNTPVATSQTVAGSGGVVQT